MKSPARTPAAAPRAAVDLAGAGAASGAGFEAGAASGAGAAAGACAATAPAAPGRVPKPRADAVRNRERILVAAREAFVEFGSEAPLDEIARRAGIGNATLYRHFPDRAALVHHVVLYVMDRVTALAEDALAEEPDAFAALCRFTHGAAAERIGALCPMLAAGFDHEHPELLAARAALETAVERLVDAGQSSGLLRPDIGVGDLMVALSQLSRPLPGIDCLGVERFVHRHLQLFLDGLRAPARSELPGAAATLDDLRRMPRH
ncbi:TetR/AcrR family transcriptional regulator [Streptomyces lavendulae]|uniref:TetR/AcrR family transcriptional regulator n=1 Tax=Streptomyces lavendulae TaxID=1914 RepID=UPI0024A19D85|nr:TetR/AcrR family transcriptional regulator [Streptomyces lavendulae]GLX21073.1 TetR family transcriptional regulator [Streptomyces lavendulae subsp. lavendulae]GLX25643.1 TetR family transcriptional regulator [Streptomyces lavendulae subsp. lavendulae]